MNGIPIKLLTILLVFYLTYPVRSYCSSSKVKGFEAEGQSSTETVLLPFLPYLPTKSRLRTFKSSKHHDEKFTEFIVLNYMPPDASEISAIHNF